MRQSLASLLLALPVAVSIGCAKPDLDFVKIRAGMTKKDIIARVGEPTRTSVVNNCDIFEYEAYDRYGALIVNRRSQFIRFVDGRVESFGNLEDLNAAKPAISKAQAAAPGTPVATVPTAMPNASTFDLRTELEKLERLKKDGLISDAEFKELRQKVLDRAKAL
jgi:hypothetical protein